MTSAGESCAEASAEYIIRDGTVDDCPAIAEIHNEWILRGGATMELEETTAESVAETMRFFGRRETFLVLERKGRILGWGVIKKYSDRAGYRVCGETSVFLHPDQTGSGLGTMLKKAVIERCRSYGYHHLVARIRAENEGSIEYNRKLGYTVVGIQKEVGHCQGRWRDVCIMQLILEDVPPFEPERGWPPTGER